MYHRFYVVASCAWHRALSFLFAAKQSSEKTRDHRKNIVFDITVFVCIKQTDQSFCTCKDTQTAQHRLGDTTTTTCKLSASLEHSQERPCIESAVFVGFAKRTQDKRRKECHRLDSGTSIDLGCTSKL